MKRDLAYSIPAHPGPHIYPLSHWKDLSRFVTGGERDPKNLFDLADDMWELWPYAAHGHPSQRQAFRLRFRSLESFLKPYVKWYCYQRLIGSGKPVTSALSQVPYALKPADSYLIEEAITSLDEFADPSVFATFWQAEMSLPEDLSDVQRRSRQSQHRKARKFWEYLSLQFGIPQRIPSLASLPRKKPTAYAADASNVIPGPVIRQLGNKLGLHREGKALLNRYDHLRLCVLVLIFCTGCRADEILVAPRGSGTDGPLNYFPIKGSASGNALWFQFAPNKQGPHEHVYISPEWCDITRYCVQALLHYGDEVRDSALPVDQGLLVLISRRNYTAGQARSELTAYQAQEDFTKLGEQYREHSQLRSAELTARGLSYSDFRSWLRGNSRRQGILEKWNITADGSPDGAIYKLRPHQARHTRQTALARDPQVPLLARQYDLNHNQPDMQFAYQHALSEQNAMLLQKACEGKLLGPALAWILELLGASYQNAEPQPRYRPGQPSQIPLRWRHLIANNPQFFQFNRVPCGYCNLPQGPQGCEEFMNCCEAEDGGCKWFVTDPENEQMFIQITRRAHAHRKQAEESAAAGRIVQAGKNEVLASRAEAMEGAVLQHASQDLRERLMARKREIEEELI